MLNSSAQRYKTEQGIITLTDKHPQGLQVFIQINAFRKKYNSTFIGSSHCRRAKSPLENVLIINLLGKGLTPRACMGDGGSI